MPRKYLEEFRNHTLGRSLTGLGMILVFLEQRLLVIPG